MRGIIATACLFIFASISGARSEIVALNVEPRVQLKMEVPPDFCPLIAGRRRADTELLAQVQRTMQSSAKLLAYLMPCVDYANVGTPAFSGAAWILIIAPLDRGQPAKFLGYTRERFLLEVANNARAKGSSGLSDGERAALDKAVKEFGVDVSQTRSLGILDRDANAVYTGSLERVATTGYNEIIAGVSAATFAAGYYISINTYSTYDNPKDFDDMLSVSKELAEVFVDDN